MPKFILIDGNAVIHRAYHAIPKLTDRTGKPVNAVYGFMLMLLKILEDFKPEYLAVAFDHPSPNFRQIQVPSYQSQRPKASDDLIPQFQLVRDVISDMKIPAFEKEGYEADDIIGTLASQVVPNLKSQISNVKAKTQKLKTEESTGIEVIIVTGDKDLFQLVNDRVKLYMPVKGLSEGKLFDLEEVKLKTGVKPSQIIDYKALVGDPSDNYKGADGIGPKTASDLLSRYGSLENIYQHLGEIKNENLRRKLNAGREDVKVSKMLATVVCGVPVNIKLKDCRIKNFNTPQVLETFQQLGFKSLIKRVTEGKTAVSPPHGAQEKSKKINENQLGFNF